MLKRYLLASLVAGLALGAQSAVADSLTFYEGHGWLPQPPISSSTDARGGLPGTVLAGPTSSVASSQSSQVVNPKRRANFCEPSGSTHPERPLEQCGY